MTNLDALKELAEAAGATDVDGIDSNLDALNATAKALGGTGESDSNADAFYEIAQNFSGGGGGGFSTCTVQYSVPQSTFLELAQIVSTKAGDVIDVSQLSGVDGTAQAVLYNGKALAHASDECDVTGDASYSDGVVTITGDCSISVHNSVG